MDQVSIGLLIDAVPRDAVDDAVTAYGVRERRSDGELPAHVVTYGSRVFGLRLGDAVVVAVWVPARVHDVWQYRGRHTRLGATWTTSSKERTAPSAACEVRGV